MSATLEKALILIEAMAKARQPCGITQLARDLGQNKSTVYRLLDILCRHGFARQDPAARTYMLTTRLWELGVSVLSGISVHSVAPPYMAEAAEATGETLLLVIPDGDASLVIDKVDSRQPLQIFSPIGTRLALHCSSVGKALMVDWPDARILAYAPERREHPTPRTIATAEALLAAVQEVRRRGWGMSHDEWQLGVSGVAAPIRDATGAVVASVGITGPTTRLAPDAFAPLGAKAVEVAARISGALGYRGPG